MQLYWLGGAWQTQSERGGKKPRSESTLRKVLTQVLIFISEHMSFDVLGPGNALPQCLNQRNLATSINKQGEQSCWYWSNFFKCLFSSYHTVTSIHYIHEHHPLCYILPPNIPGDYFWAGLKTSTEPNSSGLFTRSWKQCSCYKVEFDWDFAIEHIHENTGTQFKMTETFRGGEWG